MNFLRSIPSPEFTTLSKKKLQNLCEALQISEYIKGSTIFHQDDPQKFIYIVKDGLFASQVRINVNKKTQGLDPSDMLKE